MEGGQLKSHAGWVCGASAQTGSLQQAGWLWGRTMLGRENAFYFVQVKFNALLKYKIR